MAADQDNLHAWGVAHAFFIALVIYFRFIKQILVIRKQLCYLYSKSKPQHAFKRVLADNSYSQFKHLKRQGTDSHTDGEKSNLHPYKAEISNLKENPNLEFLNILKGCKNPSTKMEGCYVWVETEAQLRNLVEVLNNEKVFAVDTEQHGERSFLGFTSLLQISTISKDYMVDTIILHDVMELLRPVFANPGICKVFHGANGDVPWLQRDFHIYVVNLFDTEKACHVLSKPETSLAYLLQTYCSFAKNKQLQTADWRQRPLPVKMLHYARADTHYLLHIAYWLCLELVLKIYSKGRSAIESSSSGDEFHFLLKASRLSSETCLRLFVKKIEACPGNAAATSILNGQEKNSPSVCDAKFQELVQGLCLWRDVMARLHDESPRFVLSDEAIIKLAAEIPTAEIDISSTISKADLDVESPSAVVCSHLEDLLWLLQDNIASLDSIFQMLIQRHLGPAKRCPLSAYVYALPSLGLTNKITSGHNGLRASKKVVKKPASRDLLVQKKLCKDPLYKEYAVCLPNGKVLGYVDVHEKDRCARDVYAKITYEGEGPPYITILLDIDVGPDDHAIRTKKNKCVGCGKGEFCMQYNIIPRCYRRFFPAKLKSGLSQYIVLVCGNCHIKARAAAVKYKDQVAAIYKIRHELQNTPASSAPVVSSKDVHAAIVVPPQRYNELTQVEKALPVGVNPLKRQKHINLDDVKENNIGGKTPASVENALEGEDLSNEMTGPFYDSNISLKNDKKSSLGNGALGKQVVKHLQEKFGNRGICDFYREWQQVFVEAVNPRFLPDGWKPGTSTVMYRFGCCVDRSSGLIGGGIIPFSKKPYVTRSLHMALSRNQDLTFSLTTVLKPT